MFSILLAAVLLGEGVRPIQTLGIVLVLSAIVIVQLPRKGSGGAGSSCGRSDRIGQAQVQIMDRYFAADSASSPLEGPLRLRE